MTPKEQQLLGHLREATLALRETRTELEAIESEPIAIIGMACRFPGGAVDPDAFYRVLDEGRDTVQSLDDRWRLVGAEPPADVPRWAALLDSVEDFDPAFFGISPREAQTLDPQHRLLLEVSWEALEDAGIVPATLKGSRTGVFIGACTADYAFTIERQPTEAKDVYSTTGNMVSVAAGRVSYVLGLQGPCFALDTACSSSLVATHVACQSLRTRESDLALVGGVGIILAPRTMEGLARCNVLSPDGRCRTFDVSANGYVRGEGCGMLVLKRLSDARRDGDRIWALIRGSAINQDGRSAGLTAPNVLAQESVIRDALTVARISRDDLDFMECHGTGTSLGDPIEVEAVRSILGPPRQDGRPVFLGALKTNIGHLEGAAGVAAVIKTVLAMHHEKIPRNLNFRTLNPRVRLEGSPLRLASEPVAWPKRQTPRCAGISSFGISGTNAHAIVEEAPPNPIRTELKPSTYLVTLSGRTAEALRDAARKLRDHLQTHEDLLLGDVAHSLATTRTHFEHRAAMVVASRAVLLDALAEIARGETPTGVHRGATTDRGKVAFMFPGQGVQVPGAGKALYEAFPVFREALDDACVQLEMHLDRPLVSILFAEPGTLEAELLDRTEYTQPALFAFSWALVALWRSLGVVPQLLVGHSSGEIAAACVAGVFSLPDACRLVCARGALMTRLKPGVRVAIAASERQVAVAIESFADTVAIAAINGPDAIVISGDEQDVSTVAERFASRGVKTKRLPIPLASHAPNVDAILDEFRAVAKTLNYAPPSIPIVSTVSGAIAGSEIASAEYWVAELRKSVRFADAVATTFGAGAGTFVEVAPRPTLLDLIPLCVPDADPKLIASLRPDLPELESFLHAVGAWHVMGGSVEWSQVFLEKHVRVRLPTYPFQRERFWVDLPDQRNRPVHWHLSGQLVHEGGRDIHHVVVVSTERQPYLADHVVYDRIVVPGAFYVSTILAVAAEHWPAQALDLNAVSFVCALVLHPGVEVALHVVMRRRSDESAWDVEVSTRSTNPVMSVVYAHATVRLAEGDAPSKIETHEIDGRSFQDISPADVYANLATHHIQWGLGWRWTTLVRLSDGVGISAVEIPVAAMTSEAPLHPVLIDNSPASLFKIVCAGDGTPRIPFAVQRLRWFRPAVGRVRCTTRVKSSATSDDKMVSADAMLEDETGLVALVEGLSVRRAPREVMLQTLEIHGSSEGSSYRIDWQQAPVERLSHPTGTWLLVALGSKDDLHALVKVFDDIGTKCTVVTLQELGSCAPAENVMCVAQCGDGNSLTAALHVVQVVTKWREPPKLWWITRNAVACKAGEDVHPELAALWGFGRTVMQEHPELRCALIDIDRADDTTRALLHELAMQSDETQSCLRGQRRFVARIVETKPVSAPKELPVDATVMITGGLGGIGLHVARWLGEHGVRHLVLVGRRGKQTPGAAEAIASLEARGTQVTVAAVDVTDERALAEVLMGIPADRPLRGIVHAAGILDDGVIAEQTPERFARTFGPKAFGAWNLHRLTSNIKLDFFWLFSSIAASFGSAGQASYAAANAYLDGLAMHRRAFGLPATSFAWGLWAGAGMIGGLGAASRARLKQLGVQLIAPEDGLRLLEEGRRLSDTHILAMRIDLPTVRRALGEPVPAFWRSLLPPVKETPPEEAQAQNHAEWAGLPEPQRLDAILEVVSTEVARELSLPDARAVRKDQPLQELGFDSLMAVDLRNRLQKILHVSINASAIWQAETPALLALEINSLLGTTNTPRQVPRLPEPQPRDVFNPRPVLAPVSPGQERLWFLDRVIARPEVYNVHIPLETGTRLQHDILKDALDCLISRHEQLRMCFVQRDTIWQRVLPWVDIEIPEQDFSFLPADQGRRAFDDLCRAQSNAPFDLAKAPLFRVALAHLGPKLSALSFTFHHSMADGQSIAVFLREFSLAYAATAEGREPDLPPITSFVEWCKRTRKWLVSSAADEQRSHWKNELAGLPSLNVPTIRQAPKERTHNGDLVAFQLSASLSRDIGTFANGIQATPFVVLLAAWSALLSRYSRQTYFAVGVTVLGRNEPGLENTIGLFINTLPIRCDFDANPTCYELLSRLRARVWSALDHQELPLQEIVRVTSSPRSGAPSQNSLFRAHFALEDNHWMTGKFGGISIDPHMRSVSGSVEGTAKFDLNLIMARIGDQYRASLEYGSDLFDASTIERMASHFQTLIEDLVRHPDKRISNLDLIDAQERHRLLVEWNDTAVQYPQDECVHELFEQHAERTPKAIALVYEDQQLTFRQLNERSNQLAHHLRAVGVGPDVLVVLCVERSAEMIIGLLGILKAGGCYVPLDPALPSARLAYLIEDAQTPVVVTLQSSSEKVSGISAKMVCLDAHRSILDAQPTHNPTKSLSLENLVYVMYTSGSTGKPKGVAVTHGNLLNYVLGAGERLGLRGGVGYAMVSSIAADMPHIALYGSLCLGGTLHVISQERASDPQAFAEYFRIHHIDCLKITPSHFMALHSASPKLCAFPERWLVFGGEALHIEWIKQLEKLSPPCEIFNHYGPTETTCGVLTYRLKTTADVDTPTLPIGRPLPNSRMYVLDAHMELVPIGVPGELYIGGLGVARGYWNRSELTGNQFLQDPFGLAGSKIYRTGDLVRYLPNGELEFLGRIDHQVKVRGYRVELGEIESTLAQEPTVKACVVVAHDEPSGGKHLVAHVVSAPGQTATPAELKSWLGARIPEYMMPAKIVFHESFPLTPNGKIDRQAISALNVDPATTDEPHDLPTTPLENALVAIWRDVLQIENVGVRDNFFSIGGDSLAVIRVVGRAEKDGYALKPRDLFGHQTVAELARFLSARENPHTPGQTRCFAPLRAIGQEKPLLVVPGIEGMLLGFVTFVKQLRPSIPVWGFEAPEMAGDDSITSLETLAERYIRELRDVLPSSAPVRLAGHSLGGSVVLEMARQFVAAGYDVERVFLLDARPNPESPFDPFVFLAGMSELFGMAAFGSEHLANLGLEAAIGNVANNLKKANMVPDTNATSWVSRILHVARKNRERIDTWTPKPVDVPITLLKADANDADDYGWSDRLLRPIEVVCMPGNHFTMLQPPHVVTLVQCIERRLKVIDNVKVK